MAATPLYQKFSVIVPSYNRLEELKELLPSIAALDFPRERFELVIADDGSQDDTAEYMRQYKENATFNVLFATQKNQGPSAARNLGMETATGDFFIFTDSDCTVPPNWLSEIDKALTREQADVYGGPDSYLDDFPPLLKAINYSLTSFITTGGIRGHKKQKLAKFYPRTFNMGLSRKTLDEIGGFSHLLYGEDIEFAHRIVESGAKVINVLDAVVFHKRRTSVKRFWRQVYMWGSARVDLGKMDPKMMEPVYAMPAVATLILAFFVLGSLFSPAIWAIFRPLLFAGITVLFLSAVHAFLQYKDPRVAFWVPVAMPIQIIGYGIGFIRNWIRRHILGIDKLTGFK